MRVLVLVPYQHDTVPGQRFRLEQWARALEPMGVAFDFVPFESPKLARIRYSHGHFIEKAGELLAAACRRLDAVRQVDRRWDAVVIFRELLPLGPPVLERMLARRGIPVIYDFDDAIFLPAVSQANRYWRWLKWPQKTGAICRLSTHTIAGNPYLAQHARRFTEAVSVIPTTIDTDWYRPKTDWTMDAQPVVGWSGSFSTVAHLQGVAQALRTLRRQTPFSLKVIGGSLTVEGLQVECRRWSGVSEVEDLQSFDIGIMPLPDDAWARGKCGLKLLQYMAVGVPTVSSPVGVNAQIIKDGVNGFLASTPQQWMEKLGLLMRDESLRRQFGREGRRTVEEGYSAKVQAPRFLDVLHSACPQAALSLQAVC